MEPRDIYIAQNHLHLQQYNTCNYATGLTHIRLELYIINVKKTKPTWAVYGGAIHALTVSNEIEFISDNMINLFWENWKCKLVGCLKILISFPLITLTFSAYRLKLQIKPKSKNVIQAQNVNILKGTEISVGEERRCIKLLII